MADTIHFIKQKIKIPLYFFIYYSGLLHLFIVIFTIVKKNHSAAVLNYHRIVNGNFNGFLFKSATIHHDTRLFEKEMSFIKRWFNIISMDELIEHLEQKSSFNKPSIAITFDDGYRDNYSSAFPVLKKLGLPATIYTVSSLIGTTERTWLDQVDFAILKTKVTTFKLPSLLGDERVPLHSIQDKRKANNKIGEKLKRIEYRKRIKIIDELYDELKVSRDSMQKKNRVMLNWDEIKEMSKNKISFGAHTHSHPILTQMPLDKAKDEIVISKKMLEDKLKIQINHFAFPNGTSSDFNEELRKYCIDLGFKSVATGDYGINHKTSDPFSLKRIVPYVPFYIFAVEVVRTFLKTLE